MNKFNNQFATQKLRQEMSVTGTVATFTPGTGEQMATNKILKKKKVKKENKSLPKDWKDAPSIPNRPSKGGFIYKQLFEELSKAVNEVNGKMHIGTDTKTDSDIYFEPKTGAFYINVIDPAGNRWNKLQVNTIDDVLAKFPSWKWTKVGKAEFSDNLDEDSVNEPLEIDDVVKVVYGNQFYGKIGKIMDIRGGFVIVGFMYDEDGEYLDWDESLEDDREIDVEEYSMHSSDVEKIDGEDGPVSDYGRYRKDPESYEKDYQEKGTSDYFQRRSLDENYSKFKNETKTRGKSDQFHQAVRQVKKKVLEINKMYEYVSRLKGELSEGEEGLKYKMHTEKALYQIKEMVSELNKKIKRFK